MKQRKYQQLTILGREPRKIDIQSYTSSPTREYQFNSKKTSVASTKNYDQYSQSPSLDYNKWNTVFQTYYKNNQHLAQKSEACQTIYLYSLERKMQHVFAQQGPCRSIETIKRKIMYINSPTEKQDYITETEDQMPSSRKFKHPKRPISMNDICIQQFVNFLVQQSGFNIKKNSVDSATQPSSRADIRVKHLFTQIQKINQHQSFIPKRNSAEKHSSNKPPLYNDNAVTEDDRDKMQNFLNNQWIYNSISSKSFRNHQKFLECLKLFEKKSVLPNPQEVVYDESQKKKIRTKFQNGNHQINLCKTPTHEIPNQNYRQYLKIKQLKYSSAESNEENIKIYDEALGKIMKQMEENDLMQFDEFYDRTIKQKRCKRKIFCLIRKSKAMRMPIEEILSKKILNFEPYAGQGSFAFIQHAKKGNVEDLLLLLNQNKNFIYEFDEVNISSSISKLHRTPLHWAIKKNHFQCVKLLIAFESDLLASDILNFTPLHYAILLGDFLILKLLLNLRAPGDFEYFEIYRLTKDPFIHQLMCIAKMNEFIFRVRNNDLKAFFTHLRNSYDQNQQARNFLKS